MGNRIAIAVLLMLAPGSAEAGALNDWNCRPDAVHPYPVVLVHGRGGDVAGFGALIDVLSAEGYCVFGTNYGQTDGQGANGMDHLSVSGAQIDDFIDQVLHATGAEQVDMIGHSAGTGVIDNVILEKGGGGRIHRVASIGGLHHPYAHAGAGTIVDGILFLPNLIETARLFDPDITAQEVITWAVQTFQISGMDAETATSNFVDDLFEPSYWMALHGRLSEPTGTYALLGNSHRSLLTHDAIPDICYTNIVGIADLLAGPAAGFQDEAANVENVMLYTASDHGQLLGDPVAIAKVLDAFADPCRVPIDDPPPGGGDEGDDDPSGGDDGGGGGIESNGCSTTPAPSAGLALALGLGLALRRRRVRR